MQHHHHKMLSIWLFIGALLLVYGVIILAVSIAEYAHPVPVVLASRHLNLWEGLLLTSIGSVYTVRFRPRKSETKKKDQR